MLGAPAVSKLTLSRLSMRIKVTGVVYKANVENIERLDDLLVAKRKCSSRLLLANLLTFARPVIILIKSWVERFKTP